MPIINPTALETDVLSSIQQALHKTTLPSRVALSSRYPKFKKPILYTRQTYRATKNIFNMQLAFQRSPYVLPSITARHQSVLLRTLGDSDIRLQQQKVQNIQRAIEDLQGLIIRPGEIFSLWHILGRPTRNKGYVDGMLLSNGRVVEGLGGGLCQLSNFLCWLLLHAPTKVVERYHHSMDVFPDSGRILPFGSGATIVYNIVDLRLKNMSNEPLQLHMWLTEKYLKGQLRSLAPLEIKYHLMQKHHYFVKHEGQFYRYNQIWRDERVAGKLIKQEHVFTNFAPVLYDVDETELLRDGQEVVYI